MCPSGKGYFDATELWFPFLYPHNTMANEFLPREGDSSEHAVTPKQEDNQQPVGDTITHARAPHSYMPVNFFLDEFDWCSLRPVSRTHKQVIDLWADWRQDEQDSQPSEYSDTSEDPLSPEPPAASVLRPAASQGAGTGALTEPRRPPSAYQLYANDMRPMMSGSPNEVVKELTSAWLACPQDVKDDYEDLAEALKNTTVTPPPESRQRRRRKKKKKKQPKQGVGSIKGWAPLNAKPPRWSWSPKEGHEAQVRTARDGTPATAGDRSAADLDSEQPQQRSFHLGAAANAPAVLHTLSFTRRRSLTVATVFSEPEQFPGAHLYHTLPLPCQQGTTTQSLLRSSR